MTKRMDTESINNLHADGKCPNCGQPMDRIGYYCSNCVNNAKTRAYKRLDIRKENNLCLNCGEKVTNGMRLCQSCRDKRSVQRIKRIERMKALYSKII